MSCFRWSFWETYLEGASGKIKSLTSLRGNRRWPSCWGPRPCRGSVRCRRWCFSAMSSQSGIGSPWDNRSQMDQKATTVSKKCCLLSKCSLSILYCSFTSGIINPWSKLNVIIPTKTILHLFVGSVSLTFLGSMLNFFRPMAICLFLCMLFLKTHKITWAPQKNKTNSSVSTEKPKFVRKSAQSWIKFIPDSKWPLRWTRN